MFLFLIDLFGMVEVLHNPLETGAMSLLDQGLEWPSLKHPFLFFQISAYFGLSGHLFRFHPARRFGVIRPA